MHRRPSLIQNLKARFITRAIGIGLVLILVLLGNPTWSGESGTTSTPFRFGVSTRLLKGVNETDARAAVKVYTEALVQESVFPNIVPLLFDSAAALKQALEKGEVDGLSLTIEEYLSVRNRVGSVHVFNVPDQQPPGVECVVLVQRDDPAQHVRDLRDQPLILFDNPRTVMGEHWLDVVLLQDGQPPAAEFFKAILPERKLTAVVLPVFFRKARACLATRSGFETMQELNPQVGKNLRILAQSPPYISVVMCFSRQVSPELKQKLLDGISHMHERVSGQQILAIFQAGEQLVPYSAACLQPAIDLVATHQRLTASRAGAAATKPMDRGANRTP